MKKKILLCLSIVLGLFIFAGCGGSGENNNGPKNSLHPNQTGYVEGQYFIDDLTFSLYQGFKPSFQENIYQLADDNNGIVIYFYHDKDVKTSLDEFIDSDPNDFLPNKEKIAVTIINGNEWHKGVTNDNAYIYYIQQGNDVYSIMILPMFTTKTVLNEVISTLENSLYFK